MSDLPTYYTPAQVAKHFGVTEHYVKRHLTAWPRIEIGRQVRFTADHVEAIAQQHERRPIEVPAASHGQRTRGSRAS